MTHEKEIKELIEHDENFLAITPIGIRAIKAMYEENLRLKAENDELRYIKPPPFKISLDGKNLELLDEWRPIETAPKDGTSFLIYDSGEYHECWWSGNEDIGWTSYQTEAHLFPMFFPTQWKPLTPPQENE